MATATQAKPKPSNKLKAFLFSRPEKPYVNPYLGGAVLGIVLFLAFFLTGNGLGASGGLNRYIVYLEDLIAPEHVDRVAYLLKMAGGVKNPLDDWIVFVTGGAILGGFVSGWQHGRLESGNQQRAANLGAGHAGFWPSPVGRSCPLAHAWHAAAPPARRSPVGQPFRPAVGR